MNVPKLTYSVPNYDRKADYFTPLPSSLMEVSEQLHDISFALQCLSNHPEQTTEWVDEFARILRVAGQLKRHVETTSLTPLLPPKKGV